MDDNGRHRRNRDERTPAGQALESARPQGSGNAISVVIRVRDAAEELDRCLCALKRQTIPDACTLEIVVVDNESKDESRAVAQRYGAAIVPISRAEFTWGRALNRGIAQTRGDIVLLLSSDATPADETWLEHMVEPFAEADVAVVYGRQLPYPSAPIDERARLARTFGAEPISLDPGVHANNPSGKGMGASNVCAAVRRRVWEEHPYDEQISGGEEGPFTSHVLARGYRCLYQPSARVYHSHRDSPWKMACREWEILEKNAAYANARIRMRTLVKWWAGVAVRRLVNCVRADAPWYRRAEGVLRLPLELPAYVVVGVSMLRERSRRKAREVFWR